MIYQNPEPSKLSLLSIVLKSPQIKVNELSKMSKLTQPRSNIYLAIFDFCRRYHYFYRLFVICKCKILFAVFIVIMYGY